MSARAIGALLTANFRTAVSYRIRFLQTIAFSFLTVIPVFFVARAMQPMMADTIATEGRDFFAFLVIGFVVLSIVGACVDVLPMQVGGDINNGFFEALLGAPAGTPSVLLGMVSYQLLFTIGRGALMLALAAMLGVDLVLARTPEMLLILVLLVGAHLGIALLATAAVVAFRTTLSVPQLVLTASGLLGGVYWPTSVIPSWVSRISEALPISYGLRALRHTALDGRSLSGVAGDVTTLALYGGFLVAVGSLVFTWALSYARRRGTLSQY